VRLAQVMEEVVSNDKVENAKTMQALKDDQHLKAIVEQEVYLVLSRMPCVRTHVHETRNEK
jgi:hypothetical protein